MNLQFICKEDGSWVIRWCGKRKWWLIDSEGISTSDRFNAAADENVKHPHLVTTPWKVWAGMDVAEDMDLKVEVSFENLFKNNGFDSQWHPPWFCTFFEF